MAHGNYHTLAVAHRYCEECLPTLLVKERVASHQAACERAIGKQEGKGQARRQAARERARSGK